MEFKAGNAITDIPKRCCTVAGNPFGFAFDIFKQDDAIRAGDLGIFAIKAKVIKLTILDLVERLACGLFQQCRDFNAVFFEHRNQGINANGINQFKRPSFPCITQLHRIIDIDDGIRSRLGNKGRIGQRLAHDSAAILATLVRCFHHLARIFASGADTAQTRLFGFGEFTGLQIHRFLDLLTTFAVQAVKTTLALAPGITIGNQFADQFAFAIDRMERIGFIEKAGHA